MNVVDGASRVVLASQRSRKWSDRLTEPASYAMTSVSKSVPWCTERAVGQQAQLIDVLVIWRVIW